MIPVGIDISKSKVDVWLQNKLITLKNDESALRKYFKNMSSSKVKIVMEATGRYHRIAHKTLDRMGFEVMVINPFQSRHFAKSMNVLCKTDKVDAKILAQYAQRMDFKKTNAPTDDEVLLQNLIRHLDDLKEMLLEYKHRLDHSDGFTKNSLQRLIKLVKQEIKEVEARIKDLIAANKEMKERYDILTSIPGIGNTTAAVLVGLIKELGTISNKEAAALSGLAPMNCDSGAFKGKRRIQMGRHDVRRFLYMPCLGAATKHNPILKSFYKRLINAGKPAKVALVACMRKLIVFANALLKKGEKWLSKGFQEKQIVAVSS